MFNYLIDLYIILRGIPVILYSKCILLIITKMNNFIKCDPINSKFRDFRNCLLFSILEILYLIYTIIYIIFELNIAY